MLTFLKRNVNSPPCSLTFLTMNRYVDNVHCGGPKYHQLFTYGTLHAGLPVLASAKKQVTANERREAAIQYVWLLYGAAACSRSDA